MNSASRSLIVCLAATIVILPLIAATWLVPPAVPWLARQALLTVWGVGAILVCETILFTSTRSAAGRAVGFVPPRSSAVVIALLVSVPMWVFLPLLASAKGVAVTLRPDWPALLLGVVLVNGITEEVIHRGFVFRHLRNGRSFRAAATMSAMLFAAQHLYLVVTLGWIAGLASVLLAALLAFPLAFAFERGGNSLGGPAILHTSSNAPMIIFAIPADFIMLALVPHMVVTLLAMYLVFALDTLWHSRTRVLH